MITDIVIRYVSNPESIGIHLPLIAASFLHLSKLADYKTTELGIKAGLVETNPLLPSIPTKSELYSKEQAANERFLLILGTALFPVGIGLATARTGVALHNLLMLRRQIIKNKIKAIK